MLEVLSLSTSFPGVVYTVGLGVMLIYWAFVMVGVVDLGEGSEGALDGLGAEGAAKGVLEGATKGVLEGAAKGALEGSIKGALEGMADGGDGPGDGGDGHEASALAALMSALRLNQVPATVVLSLLVTFSWLLCVVAMQVVGRAAPAISGVAGWVSLFGAPILAVPMTSLTVRPLASVFAHRRAPSRSDLVGKTCVVRTGTVTDRFGEGTIEDGGAGLVVRLRVDGGECLKRGDTALIVDWDAERDAFVVAPMGDVLGKPPGARGAG
jgi:hypothetical protein